MWQFLEKVFCPLTFNFVYFKANFLNLIRIVIEVFFTKPLIQP